GTGEQRGHEQSTEREGDRHARAQTQAPQQTKARNLVDNSDPAAGAGGSTGSGPSQESPLQLVAETAHRDDVARIGGVALDLGAQPAHMHVDQTAVAEVAVAPHPLEERLTRQDSTGILRELDEQTELGLGEVQLFAV